MISRLSQSVARRARRVGVPYVRVPAMQAGYRRPFASGDHRGVRSKLAFPYVRIPTVKVKLFRPFH
jgi:hypothetical protein